MIAVCPICFINKILVKRRFIQPPMKNSICEICLIQLNCYELNNEEIDMFEFRKLQLSKQNPMKEERNLKMSIETAREVYKKAIEGEGRAAREFVLNLLNENFTKEELKEKKGYTWEESFSNYGSFINSSTSEVESVAIGSDAINERNKCLFKTDKQAKSALAFSQLSHILSKYNEKESLDTLSSPYGIVIGRNKKLYVESFSQAPIFVHLLFLRKADAETSLIVNKELWEQYWML